MFSLIIYSSKNNFALLLVSGCILLQKYRETLNGDTALLPNSFRSCTFLERQRHSAAIPLISVRHNGQTNTKELKRHRGLSVVFIRWSLTHTAAEPELCTLQAEPAYSLGRSPSPRSRTLACSHTSIRISSLLFNGLHPSNPCNYMDIILIRPRGMDG